MNERIAVIGSGFSGLTAAAYLAKSGREVHLFEKNVEVGGRARQFKTDSGFVFDMGPSWYWMGDILDRLFADFGYKREDFYELINLNPQFEMVFSDRKIDVPQDMDGLRVLFEELEPGSGIQLERFMQSAKYKYEVGMQDFVIKPCHNWMEFMSLKIAKSAVRLDLLSNFRDYVGRYFKSPYLRALMEFPVIFLGASPKQIPAMYSLMNYGGYALGTHYPMGGFYSVVRALKQIAEEHGVVFHVGSPVEEIAVEDAGQLALRVQDKKRQFDKVVCSSDYHHTETLLPPALRNYSEEYWESRTFAPSSLIFYLGINEKIPNLKHHTLFFEHDLDEHIEDIYGTKKWPENPLFYVCCPSKTDDSVAPPDKENIFILMPLAIDIDDDDAVREEYLEKMLKRLAQHTGVQDLHEKIEYKRSFCVRDFKADYNAYGGNAYGLANTLKQTAVWKPKLRNKYIENLYYTGHLTVPGPGVPPAIISGKIVAHEIIKSKETRA